MPSTIRLRVEFGGVPIGIYLAVSGHPVPDAAELVFYRPDFYSARAESSPMGRCAGRPRGRWPIGS